MGRRRYISVVFSFLLAMALVLAACQTADKSESEQGKGDSGKKAAKSATAQGNAVWEPEKPIEFVAPAGAGGGWDTTARTVQQVLSEEGLVKNNIMVVNKPGGGGAIGWTYIHDQKDGDPHTLFVTSPPIMFVPLNGQSEYNHKDFTPIAGLIADYAAFVVKADAKWQTMEDLVVDLKKNPRAISVVGDSAPGSMDHMQFVKAVHAAKVDARNIKFVSSQDGNGMAMLLGGQVDVYSTGLAEATEQAKAGKVRVLAITAPERLKEETVSEFPTLKEQGIDDEFIVWRGFMGPPNMDPAAVKYWEETLRKMTETDKWQEKLESYGWEANFMTSEEFGNFLDKEYDVFEKLMQEIGLKKGN